MMKLCVPIEVVVEFVESVLDATPTKEQREGMAKDIEDMLEEKEKAYLEIGGLNFRITKNELLTDGVKLYRIKLLGHGETREDYENAMQAKFIENKIYWAVASLHGVVLNNYLLKRNEFLDKFLDEDFAPYAVDLKEDLLEIIRVAKADLKKHKGFEISHSVADSLANETLDAIRRDIEKYFS